MIDKQTKDGIYEISPIVKESINIPNKNATIAAFIGELLSENGNNKITGQQGVIPFISSQEGDIITQDCKQIIIKKINNLLLFLTIIIQDLNPIYCLR